MHRLTVATLNLLYYPMRWSERRTLILDGFRELQPDIIGLQEVSERMPTVVARAVTAAAGAPTPSLAATGVGDTPAIGTSADWLAAELGGYSVHYVPREGWLDRRAGRFGIAVLSRLPVLEHAQLSLGSQGRMAQRVLVQGDAGPFVICNGHYYFSPMDSTARTRQIERLLAWLGAIPSGMPIVAVGDFNGTPETAAIQLMRTRFSSAHAVHHGREPAYTCPTPLVYPGDRLRWAARHVLSLMMERQWRAWHGVLDYVFVNEGFAVADCQVFLDQPAAHDAGLYASDHFGLWAELKVS